jgi:hypothetical protein
LERKQHDEKMEKFLKMTKEMEMGIKKRDQAIKKMELVDNL